MTDTKDDLIRVKLTLSTDMTMATLVVYSDKPLTLEELTATYTQYAKEINEKLTSTH